MLAVNVQMLACMNSELHWNSDGKLVVSFIFLRIAGYDVFLVLSDSIKGLWKAIMVNLSIFLYYLFWWFIQVVVLNNMNGEGVMELIVQVGSDAIVIALYFTHHVLVIKYWSSPERVPWKVVPLKHPWRVKHIIINRTWCMNSLLFTIPSYLVLTLSLGKRWRVIRGNSVLSQWHTFLSWCPCSFNFPSKPSLGFTSCHHSRSYVFSSLATSAVSFATGALGMWIPLYLHRAQVVQKTAETCISQPCGTKDRWDSYILL